MSPKMTLDAQSAPCAQRAHCRRSRQRVQSMLCVTKRHTVGEADTVREAHSVPEGHTVGEADTVREAHAVCPKLLCSGSSRLLSRFAAQSALRALIVAHDVGFADSACPKWAHCAHRSRITVGFADSVPFGQTVRFAHSVNFRQKCGLRTQFALRANFCRFGIGSTIMDSLISITHH